MLKMSASNIWITIGLILGAMGTFSFSYGFYLKTHEDPPKPAEEKRQVNKPIPDMKQVDIQNVAKIKVNRYLDDYKASIEELKQAYFKKSTMIAENMSGRGVLRSSIHIKAQMDYAIETKKEINTLFIQMSRNIEDVLLETFNTNTLSNVAKLQEEYKKYNYLIEMNKIIYKEMEDNVKSWNVRINGSMGITKDFTLE